MKLITVQIPRNYENSYLYFDEYLKKGAVIDPGGDADRLLCSAKEFGVEITAVLLTHGHYDHIEAVDEIANKTNAKVYAMKDEIYVLENPEINLSGISMDKPLSIKPDVLLSDGDIITIGETEIRVIHTPGHTKGSVCYYDLEHLVLFSGDTLFFESVGRTDFPTGNASLLYKSIKGTLFALPDETVVYPGHYHKTSIGYEKLNNPFMDEDRL